MRRISDIFTKGETYTRKLCSVNTQINTHLRYTNTDMKIFNIFVFL